MKAPLPEITLNASNSIWWLGPTPYECVNAVALRPAFKTLNDQLGRELRPFLLPLEVLVFDEIARPSYGTHIYAFAEACWDEKTDDVKAGKIQVQIECRHLAQHFQCDPDFVEEVVKRIEAKVKLHVRDGTFLPPEHDETLQKLGEVFKHMPLPRAGAINDVRRALIIAARDCGEKVTPQVAQMLVSVGATPHQMRASRPAPAKAPSSSPGVKTPRRKRSLAKATEKPSSCKRVAPASPGSETVGVNRRAPAATRPVPRSARAPMALRLDNPITVHMSTPFDPHLPDPGPHRPWYHLNWSVMASLRRNQRKLSFEQRFYLRLLEERVQGFSSSSGWTGVAEDDYRSVACLVAMSCARSSRHDRDASADLSFRDRFLRCGTLPVKVGKHGEYRMTGTCGFRRLCPYCNYLLRQKALLTYVPAFTRGYWFSMTISSAPPHLDLEFDELTHSWDAGKAVVQALLKAGHFQGAYWTEELALFSLCPDIRVNPHCHVIFHALGDVHEAAAQALAEVTFRRHFADLRRAAARRGAADSVTVVEPSIELASLMTKSDLYRATDYLTKTTRVLDAYSSALAEVGDELRWRINTQFEQFLTGMMLMLEEDSPARKHAEQKPEGENAAAEEENAGQEPEEVDAEKDEKPAAKKNDAKLRPRTRMQRHSLGTLRPGRSSRFVGVRPADRRQHRAALRALRAEIDAERQESANEEEGNFGML